MKLSANLLFNFRLKFCEINVVNSEWVNRFGHVKLFVHFNSRLKQRHEKPIEKLFSY